MKKSFYFIVFMSIAMLFCACNDIKYPKTKGQLLFPGIRYGDDVEDLINNGVKLVKDEHDDGYYNIDTVFYGVDYIKTPTMFMYITTEKDKVNGMVLSYKEPMQVFLSDSVPKIIEVSEYISSYLLKELKTIPIENKNDISIYKTQATTYTWKENGLIYELSMYPYPNNDVAELYYSVMEE